MKPLISWKPVQYNFNVASARVRTFLPCQYLQEAGWLCEVFQKENKKQYQLVVFQKAYEPKDLILAEELKSQGTKIVLDLCDNHFYNPYNLKDYIEKEKRMSKMIELADAVTVATPELGKLISHPQVMVIDDIIYFYPLSWQGSLRSKFRRWRNYASNEFRVVWFGNSKLAKVYEREGIKTAPSGLSIISKAIPALEKLHREQPVRLTVISNSKQHFERETKGVSFPAVYHEWEISSFPILFQENDTCIIPFDINPFTICKTNNRMAASLSLGVSVIADKIPSYAEFSEFALFENWEENLRTYATNKKLRQQHVEQGGKYVRRTYNKQRAIDQWSALFKLVLKDVDKFKKS